MCFEYCGYRSSSRIIDHGYRTNHPLVNSPQSGKLAKIFFGFFGTETKGVTGYLHILLNDVWLKI